MLFTEDEISQALHDRYPLLWGRAKAMSEAAEWLVEDELFLAGPIHRRDGAGPRRSEINSDPMTTGGAYE